MIKHHLKLVLRNLWRKKIYSSVILLSLTLGFACANLLITFLVSETNTDSFHSKGDRIYQVFSSDPMGLADNNEVAYILNIFNDYAITNYAEIENICQVKKLRGIAVETGPNTVSDINLLSVDSSFFTLFDFPVSKSRKGNLLQGENIVISKEKAIAIFGNIDVVGKVVSLKAIDTTYQLVVSAVLDKPSENSHMVFDALVHHSVFKDKWGGASYVLLSEHNEAKNLEAKINEDAQRPGLLGPGSMDYYLNPLIESYFNKSNMGFMKTRDPMFITIGYIVCGIILFIASFNFINLFLLSWESRKKEIGIKKTLGVTINGLFGLTIIDAAVYIFIAYFLSLLATFSLIPLFNSTLEAHLSVEYLLNLRVLSIIALVVFLSGMLVVLLSVFRQWRMKPTSLMEKGSSKVRFSKLLFTLQFAISITLAICAVTIMQQMDFIEHSPLGFNRSLIQLKSPDQSLNKDLKVVKNHIAQIAGVDNVSICSGNPISGSMFARYDLEDDQFYTPFILSGDEDFLKTLDLKLIEGQMPTETLEGKLVNLELVRYFNMQNPLGEIVPGTKSKIVGVVENFTHHSFRQEASPVVISYKSEGSKLLVDYRGQSLAQLLPKVKAEWKKVFPDHQFSHRIIQEDLMNSHKEETFFYKIVIAFSVTSMLLSSFGLFALSWAVIQSRSKEMGIRKVLGASPVDILNLLTQTFTWRIAIAFIIAVPTGYYLMEQWLTRFASRIELNISIFAISAIIILVVAAFTLSMHTVKATMTNPVDEIRND